MKNKQIIPMCIAILLCFCFAQCKKTNTPSPTDQLPPTTQTVANTFGCLVNGKVYVPKGSSGTGSPNPKPIYDIGLNGVPNLLINANQYENNDQIGNFELFIDSISQNRIQTINIVGKQFGFGSTAFLGCGFLRSDTILFKKGAIYITKYDQISRIVSGTFNIKIKPNNCDTLFFTDGRFDLKL